MKQARRLAVFVCALGLVGLTGATDYNDANDGNWTEPGTWDLGSAYPASGDTATLDSNSVKVNIALTGNAAPDGITLAGGKLTRYGDGMVRVDSPIAVSSASEISADPATWSYGNRGLELRGNLTGAGKLTSNGLQLKLYGNDTGLSGGWDIVNSAGISAYTDGAFGTGALTFAPGAHRACTVYVYADQTAANAPAAVQITGGVFRSWGNVDGWVWELTDVDSFGFKDRSITGGSMTINGTCNFGGNEGGITTIACPLLGTGTIHVSATSWVDGPVAIGTNNSTWGGKILVDPNMTLYFEHDDAVGDGVATVQGTLGIGGMPTGLGTAVTLDGGRLFSNDAGNHKPDAAVLASATVTLLGQTGVFVIGDRTMTIDGKLIGDGSLKLDGATWETGNGATIVLSNAANNYHGGTQVNFGYGSSQTANCKAVITADGALGDGTVVVYNSRLVTDPAGGGGSVADAVLASVPAVEARGGTIELNSTENHGKIHLCEGGLLINTAGSTTISYGAAGNIHVHEGAIIHPDLPLPTATEIEGACTKAGKAGQVYVATAGLASGEQYDVAGVVMGLGTMDNNPTISGTVSEAAGAGISFYAQDLRRMEFDGAKLLTMGPVNLEGGGARSRDEFGGNYTGFYFNGASNFSAVGSATVVNMNADGRLYIEDAGGLPSGVTVNLNKGYCRLGAGAGVVASGATVNVNDGAYIEPAGDANLADGCQVNVNDNGIFYISDGRSITTGSVAVKAGGMVACWRPSGMGAGVFEFPEARGQILLGTDNIANLPTNGNVDFVLWDYTAGQTQSGGLVLSETGRLIAYREVPGQPSYNVAQFASEVTPTGSVGRLTAATGYGLWMNGKVNFPGATLIVGDTAAMDILDAGAGYDAGGGKTFVNLTQEGTVELRSTDNVMAAIDVRAGTLYADNVNKLGGATAINVDAGATVECGGNPTLAATLTGEGTFKVGTMTMLPTATIDAVVSPGSSPGVLTVQGNLKLDDLVAADTIYSKLLTEVVGHGGEGGQDHDQLQVTGNFNVTDGALVIDLPLPSSDLSPTVLATGTVDMVIAHAGSVTGFFAKVGTSGDTDDHWVIGGSAVEVLAAAGGGKDVVLHGSAVSWNGFGGDADLNGVVNYLDLGVLATNYDLTGMGWADGDYNFDGKVDYMDLGVLATNYDLTEPGGGANIPEPAFAILLGAGALGLLRRRRQR